MLARLPGDLGAAFETLCIRGVEAIIFVIVGGLDEST